VEGVGAVASGMTVPQDVSGPRDALTHWLKHHCAVLQWACVNAFELKNHLEKGLDHVFLIQLKTVQQTLTKQMAVKLRLQIETSSLVNHVYLMQTYPGVVSLFARQNEMDNIQGKADGTVSSNMLVQYESKWQLQQMMWEQGELDGLESQEDWVHVLLSITKGINEFKMVDGNPLRQ